MRLARLIRLGRHRAGLWVLVGAVSATACGQPSTDPVGSEARGADVAPVLRLDELGQCSDIPDGVAVSEIPISARMAAITELVAVDADTVRDVAANASLLDGDHTAYDLSALLGSTVSLGRRAAAGAKEKVLVAAALDLPDLRRLPSGTSLLIGLEDFGSGMVGVGVAAVELEGGELAFVGECASSRIEPVFRSWASEHGGAKAPRDVLIGLLTSQTELDRFEEWVAGPPVAHWEDRNARERRVDVEETPEAVLASMNLFSLEVSVPDEFTSLDASLCTWVGEGWNECYLLAALGDEDSNLASLLGYAKPAGTVEVWVLPANGDILNPVGKIGEFTLPEGHRASSFRITAALVAAETPTDAVELATAIDADHVALTDVVIEQ